MAFAHRVRTGQGLGRVGGGQMDREAVLARREGPHVQLVQPRHSGRGQEIAFDGGQLDALGDTFHQHGNVRSEHLDRRVPCIEDPPKKHNWNVKY